MAILWLAVAARYDLGERVHPNVDKSNSGRPWQHPKRRDYFIVERRETWQGGSVETIFSCPDVLIWLTGGISRCIHGYFFFCQTCALLQIWTLRERQRNRTQRSQTIWSKVAQHHYSYDFEDDDNDLTKQQQFPTLATSDITWVCFLPP